MNYFGFFIKKLTEEFEKLPGIGGKSAQRLAFYVASLPHKNILELTNSLLDIKNKLKYCQICSNFSDNEICEICSCPERNPEIIMVIEKPQDILLVEQQNKFKNKFKNKFNGLYHVLHGLISPINNIGPDNLKINQLIDRVKLARSQNKVQEVIIATDTSVEGEATAIYINNLLAKLDIETKRDKNIFL